MPLTARLHRLVTSRTSPRPYAAMRVLLGAAAAWKVVLLARIMEAVYKPGLPRLPYFRGMGEPPQALLTVLVMAAGTAAACFALGLRTRAAGAVLAAALGAILALDQQLYSNHLYLLAILVLLLTVADSGAALSLDARRRGEPADVPAWPGFLLRCQVSIVYGFTVLAKLNPEFLSGTVLGAELRTTGPLALSQEWRVPAVLVALSLATLAAEAFVAAGLWVRRLRPAAFVAGLGLHAGIVWGMRFSWEFVLFSLVMLSPYVMFIDARQGSRLVVWDGRSAFCRRWVGMVRRLDWLCVHRFAPAGSPDAAEAGAQPGEALAVAGPDGERTAGFAALGRTLEPLPLAFLWAPLLRLPPLRALGERAFRAAVPAPPPPEPARRVPIG